MPELAGAFCNTNVCAEVLAEAVEQAKTTARLSSNFFMILPLMVINLMVIPVKMFIPEGD